MNDNVMLCVRKIAPRLLQCLLNKASHLPVQLVYESHPDWPLSCLKTVTQSRKPLRISVLDSSFNPPTLAHLALIDTHLPLEWAKDVNAGLQESVDYDAKLLLLSVKNADKVLKPGDANYLQRLEMMSLLTRRMASTNVAIAITNEPTFVRKSEALLALLKQKLASSPLPTIELTFLLGSDTLERLFSPRYYLSEANMRASLQKFLSSTPEGDNSRIVSARRTIMPITSQSTMEPQTSSALVKHYLDSGRITIADIGEELSTYSSSHVRSTIAQGGPTPGDETRPLWHNYVTTEIAKYIVEEQLYAINS